ncbi:MAG: HAMP domain-containing sensor histidine kinase [bacterium]
MFKKARIKLTGWYLLIFTIIVVIFSVAIYRLVDLEISRISQSQRVRIERWRIMSPSRMDMPSIVLFDETEIANLHQRLILMLIFVDMVIIVVAGGLGYILAGKTLFPIEDVVNKQEQFVADSSHELRTPLTALRTSLEVALRDKKMKENPVSEVLNENLKEVIRLQYLAENLLELVRSGKSLTLSPVDLQTCLENVFQQISKLAKEKNIEILLPKNKLTVKASQLALERAFIIVIDNAIKYSDPMTKIHITTKIVDKNVIIVITDQGKGIPPSQLGKVFERFYRGDSARSNVIPGYGLGLSIARELMASQGGNISIESNINAGTKVLFKLPLSV